MTMPDTPELPPTDLPEPTYLWDRPEYPHYTPEQVRAILASRATRLAEAPKGWISVEDRLPEVGTDCLVWCVALGPGKHFAKVDRWDEQREAPVGWSSATIPVGDGWDDSDYEDITHWMPLPPAPDAAPAASSPEPDAGCVVHGLAHPCEECAASSPEPEHAQLMKFYGVDSLSALVAAQERHVERLQAKLPQAPNVFAPQRVREG